MNDPLGLGDIERQFSNVNKNLVELEAEGAALRASTEKKADLLARKGDLIAFAIVGLGVAVVFHAVYTRKDDE